MPAHARLFVFWSTKCSDIAMLQVIQAGMAMQPDEPGTDAQQHERQPDAPAPTGAPAAAAQAGTTSAQQVVAAAQALQVQSFEGRTAALAPVAQHIVSEEQLEILRVFQQVLASGCHAHCV